MWSTGDRVAAAAEMEADGGTVAAGDVGYVVGRQGELYVVRFGPGVHAVVPASDLVTPRARVQQVAYTNVTGDDWVMADGEHLKGH